MAKLKRWKCGDCGSGVLAPTRPRKNDVRRYCLDCSRSTGYLVERTAPALEAKRAVAKIKTVEKQKTRAVKSREQWMVAGIDAEKYMQRLSVLPVYGGRKGKPYRYIKSGYTKLVIHRLKNPARWKLGHCSSSEIALYVSPDWTERTLREVLMHELMHIIVPHKNGRSHPRVFHQKMVTAWRQSIRKFGEPVKTGTVGKWTATTLAKVEASMGRAADTI